ncbi:MAG: orotidine 5'-phosphate decarboxylase [Phycisphaerae bacterium]|nr:MAG: orotidine 5'-phosphate decarboxylase [Phycisphaerae bacterium]
MHPTDHLHEAIIRAGSPICVGMDPVYEQLPDAVRARHHEPLAAIGEFGRGVLRAIAGVAPAVKFQSACYERYGSRGVAVLEEHLRDAAQAGLFIVLDAKRGDIGISAAHYAAAALRGGAHAVTVSGYLGPSGVTPFLDAGLGVFVLVRTSNPDSDAVQGHALRDGRTVAEMMADHVAALGASRLGACGLSAVGAVVGATKSAEAAALRARMPDQVFLVPGYGAQGGTAEDIRAMLRADRRGVLVTASRSVIYAKGDGAWDEAVRDAATRFRDEIAAVIAGS